MQDRRRNSARRDGRHPAWEWSGPWGMTAADPVNPHFPDEWSIPPRHSEPKAPGRIRYRYLGFPPDIDGIRLPRVRHSHRRPGRASKVVAVLLWARWRADRSQWKFRRDGVRATAANPLRPL